jgi:uroporphyrin-III C-methyltransferase / precorrin-2 dehydrogenase / sirohydrochlorin ferrochelatase
MRFYPIFVATTDKRILVEGGGEVAVAKLRLLMKTTAKIEVYAKNPVPEIEDWAKEGRLTIVRHKARREDLKDALLAYGATGNDDEDAAFKAMAEGSGVLVNLVDNLHGSDFITPSLVDRDPVTVAIGTEGAAPLLGRHIKARLEEMLPNALGEQTRIAQAFRPDAEALPEGRARRDFWAEYHFGPGPKTTAALHALLDRHLKGDPKPGRIDFVGAGPGDPELLTMKARRLLDQADVVIHDRLVPEPVIDLCRREALIIDAGKEGFGPSTPQDAIHALMIGYGLKGAQVVRLKSGDPTVFGRLDEELSAIRASGLAHSVVPGITAASASASSLQQSLTSRGRNSDFRLITGHDMEGFADHDWQALARPGAVTAIYMGKKAARFIQGRILMHGADPVTAVTAIENASRPEERVLATTLAAMSNDLHNAGMTGPVLIFIGLSPYGVTPEPTRKEAET